MGATQSSASAMAKTAAPTEKNDSGVYARSAPGTYAASRLDNPVFEPSRAVSANPVFEPSRGSIVALVLLMATTCAVFFGAVTLYASCDIVLPKEQKEKSVRARRLARLLSGWANMGNAVVHLLLIIALQTDTERYKLFFPDEAETPVGPAVLLVINGLVGRSTLKGGGLTIGIHAWLERGTSGVMLIESCDRALAWAAVAWNSFVAVMGSLIPLVWPKFIDVGLATWPPLAIFLWLGIWAFESTAFFFAWTAYALKDAHAVKAD
jgi:hypothetical protein